jgi:hypothetical protein
MLVAHTCNPSYSGGRDQEDQVQSQSRQINSSQDLILKKPLQKMAGGVVPGVGPEFKSQYLKKKKRNEFLK